MQFLVIVSTLLAAASFVAATPQSIGIVPSGEPCAVTLPDLCESGTCTPAAGLEGALVGVSAENSLFSCSRILFRS